MRWIKYDSVIILNIAYEIAVGYVYRAGCTQSAIAMFTHSVACSGKSK